MVCVGVYTPTHTIFRDFLVRREQIRLFYLKLGGVMSAQNIPKRNQGNSKSHMPENSVLFERIIPAALIFMGISDRSSHPVRSGRAAGNHPILASA